MFRMVSATPMATICQCWSRIFRISSVERACVLCSKYSVSWSERRRQNSTGTIVQPTIKGTRQPQASMSEVVSVAGQHRAKPGRHHDAERLARGLPRTIEAAIFRRGDLGRDER